jgi:hypothetical protein
VKEHKTEPDKNLGLVKEKREKMTVSAEIGRLIT